MQSEPFWRCYSWLVTNQKFWGLSNCGKYLYTVHVHEVVYIRFEIFSYNAETLRLYQQCMWLHHWCARQPAAWCEWSYSYCSECFTYRVLPVQNAFLSNIPVGIFYQTYHFAMQAKSKAAIGNELSLDSNMLHSMGPVTTRRNSRSLAIQNASQAKSFRNRSVSNILWTQGAHLRHVLLTVRLSIGLNPP